MTEGANFGKNVNFKHLIKNYEKLQSNVLKKVQSLAKNTCGTNPGAFLLLQFQMAQMSQIGDSVSNMIYQVNSMVNSTIRNQKVQ